MFSQVFVGKLLRAKAERREKAEEEEERLFDDFFFGTQEKIASGIMALCTESL